MARFTEEEFQIIQQRLHAGKHGLPPAVVQKPAAKPVMNVVKYDSALELRYEQYLMCLKFSGEITSYTYHPFKVMLAPKRWYTPDFLLVYRDVMVCVELKGSLKMKNARDSITRLHVAAGRLPGFTWKLVQRVKGQWVEEVVHGV